MLVFIFVNVSPLEKMSAGLSGPGSASIEWRVAVISLLILLTLFWTKGCHLFSEP